MFSAAKTQAQTVWALTCGVALGALIGAAVNFFVTGRLPGRAAAVASAAIFAIVLTTCTFLCFWIDHKGIIRGRSVGFNVAHVPQMEQKIEKMLGELKKKK